LLISNKISGLEADRLRLEEAKVRVNYSINQAKSHYEDMLVKQIKDEPKRFWNHTRHTVDLHLDAL
jgi:hypothetical protein